MSSRRKLKANRIRRDVESDLTFKTLQDLHIALLKSVEELRESKSVPVVVEEQLPVRKVI